MDLATSSKEKEMTLYSRAELMEELYRRYGGHINGFRGLRRILRFWRKKYVWLAVVGGSRFVKRATDIFVSLLALSLLSPLFLTVALIIKLTDRGRVFFWQTRVGRWGREFTFPKFRSMVTNAEALKNSLLEQNEHCQNGDRRAAITFKIKKDPRVTWIGRIIRKTSIDELPQLWCVFLGQMSLVGPRPPVPREVEEYTVSDRRRLDVTPGLTCIWQVSGRGNIPFPQQVELDVQYIESQSLWLDFKILLKTIPAVLSGRGAY